MTAAMAAMLLIGHAASNASLARAQEASPEEASPEEASPPEEIEELTAADRPERRAIPDYDGRPPLGLSAGQRAAWIPRLLVAPLYVAFEYLVRRPLGTLVSFAEQVELQQRFFDFFSFGPDDNMMMVPTVSFDFGFRPNIGLVYSWKEAGHENNSVRAAFSFGGLAWQSASIADRYEAEDGSYTFGLAARANRRPDGLFWGTGREVTEAGSSRYNWTGYDLELQASTKVWRQTSFGMNFGLRAREFGDEVGGSTSIPDRVEQGVFAALPNGYEDGFFVYYNNAAVTFDTRNPRPDSGTGVRLRGSFELAYDLEDGPHERMWAQYGGSAGAFVDVTGHNHVLGATIGLTFTSSLAGEVPFTELPTLSGDGPMRGFVGQQLIGDSGAVLLLDYHWPVWFWLDGTMHVAFGNVFDGHLEGFAPEDLRMSFGLGLAAVSKRDHFFEFLVGFGTDELSQGPDVESVRVVFGGTREF